MDQGKGRALGAILAESEMISPADIESALAEQRRTGVRFGEALVNLNIVSAEDVRWGLAQQFNIPFVRVRADLVDPEAARVVPEDFARRYKVVPYLLIGDELTVIIEDPTYKRAIADLEAITGKHVTIAVGLAPDIEKALTEIYGPGREQGMPADDLISDLFSAEQQDAIRKDYTGEVFLRLLLSEAERRCAGSIHFEPRPGTVVVRLRASGQMLTAATIGRAWARGIIQRIKTALVDVERRSGLCEGFYHFAAAERKVVFHVSCIETINGESTTMVNMTPDDLPCSVEEMDDKSPLNSVLARRDGLLLLLGPDRPDKFKLFELFLAKKKADTKKTVVVGRLPWFATSGFIHLRPTAERWEEMLEVLGVATQQDPDLLVIDDLTQPRLLNAALYAALGSSFIIGGLRFATLASGLDFVLEAAENRTALCSALRGVVNYAVVPRLCTSCKTKEDRGPRAAKQLGWPLEATLPDLLRRSAGCEKCGGTGYRGVFVLLEVLDLTDDLVALLKSGEPPAKVVPQLLSRVEPSLVSQARELASQGEIAADDVASLMGNGSRGAN